MQLSSFRCALRQKRNDAARTDSLDIIALLPYTVKQFAEFSKNFFFRIPPSAGSATDTFFAADGTGGRPVPLPTIYYNKERKPCPHAKRPPRQSAPEKARSTQKDGGAPKGAPRKNTTFCRGGRRKAARSRDHFKNASKASLIFSKERSAASSSLARTE